MGGSILQIGLSPQCVLCDAAPETVNHLFFQCSFSAELWKKIFRSLQFSRSAVDQEVHFVSRMVRRTQTAQHVFCRSSLCHLAVEE